jgi:2-dehydropantoate 2-reductase
VRITVVGAGAVGSLLGARLAASGASVRLVGRPDHIAAIQRDGLVVEGVGAGRWRIEAGTGLESAHEPDLILLTTKTFDLAGASADIGRVLPGPRPILLPQNGLHPEAVVATELARDGWPDPGSVLVRAVNTIPVTLVGPGVVRQPGEGELVLADPDRAGSARVATSVLMEALRSAGLPVRPVPDLELELWRKALVNAAINPVTALHRIPNGALRTSPYHEEAEALLREAQSAAAVAGYAFTDPDADRSLERVIDATAANRSSMLQDVERGRATEIDAISGELLRTAARAGLDLPATRDVVARLSSVAPRSGPAQLS